MCIQSYSKYYKKYNMLRYLYLEVFEFNWKLKKSIHN